MTDLRTAMVIDSRNNGLITINNTHYPTFCGAGPKAGFGQTRKRLTRIEKKNVADAAHNVTFEGVAGRRTSLLPDRCYEV